MSKPWQSSICEVRLQLADSNPNRQGCKVAFRIAAVFSVPLDQVFQYDGDRTASEKKKV